MKISVLGSGCTTCKKLYETVVEVVKKENIDAEVEYSTDVTRIVELGLMHSPVLVIDGKPVDFKSVSEKDIKSATLDKIENPSCSCCGGC